MITVNSLSGGKTSSYIAAKYPADYNVFSLVTTNDKNCLFPDPKLRKIVSDKIGKDFVGTLEMDTIIYTMLDLEQFIGQEILWLSGETFDELMDKHKNRLLPSPLRRYCTTELKLKPIFDWWYKEIKEVVEMRIGFRANEGRRAKNMLDKCNDKGYLEFNTIIGKSKSGNQNKWKSFEWQEPSFPLMKPPIYKDNIEVYWKDKDIRFAEINNCVGCFHRSIPLLKKMWQTHENKMQFFSNLELNRKFNNDTFKMDKNITYQSIKDWDMQTELGFDDFNDCDSGYCGL